MGVVNSQLSSIQVIGEYAADSNPVLFGDLVLQQFLQGFLCLLCPLLMIYEFWYLENFKTMKQIMFSCVRCYEN